MRGTAAERPLPVRVLVLVLLLLAVAASVCLKPVHGAGADAAPPASGARIVQASAAAPVHAPDAPGDDDRYCSKQKTTQGQGAPNTVHEAPSTLVPATLAPPRRVPSAVPGRDEIGPSPPEPRHILLSVLRI